MKNSFGKRKFLPSKITLQAENDLQEAEINLSRVQQKLGALGAGTGGAGQTRYDIRSPIDGVVTSKKCQSGTGCK